MRQGIHMEQHRQKIASPKTQLRQDFFFSLKEKFPLTSDHHGMYTAKKETRDALHTGLFQKRNPKAVPSFFFFLRNNAGRRAFLSYDQDSIRSSSSWPRPGRIRMLFGCLDTGLSQDHDPWFRIGQNYISTSWRGGADRKDPVHRSDLRVSLSGLLPLEVFFSNSNTIKAKKSILQKWERPLIKKNKQASHWRTARNTIEKIIPCRFSKRPPTSRFNVKEPTVKKLSRKKEK